MSAIRFTFCTLLFLAPAISQAPSASVYGTGCAGLELGGEMPIVGGNWDLTTVGLPPVSPFAVNFVGATPVPTGLPLPQLGINAPGCSAYIGNIVTSLSAPNIGGVAQMSLPLPPDPLLVGLDLAVQSVGLTAQNPSLIATSNGLIGTVGDNPGFHDLVYNNENVLLDYGNGMPPQMVNLNGFVAVSPQGFANGIINAVYADGTQAMIQYMGSDIMIMSGSTILDLGVNAAPGQFFVNAQPVPVDPVLDGFLADFGSGAAPGQWNGTSQALLGLCAINATPAMNANFFAGQVAAAAAPGWFCKSCATTFSVAAAALAFAGCNAIAVACGASATITVGGSVIACAPLITACYGGLLATPAVAYWWYINNVWS